MAVALTTLAIGLIAGGVTTQAVGQVKAGNAARRVGEANQRAANASAELMDYNATVADIQAQDAISRGTLEEQRYRSMARGVTGGQRADFAGQNVAVNSGSALDVQADTSLLSELDARTIRQNAMREAWGYQVAAYDDRKRAEIARKEGVVLAESGRAQQSASRFAAAGSVIGGGGSLLMMRYGFQQATTSPATSGFRQSDIFAYGGLG